MAGREQARGRWTTLRRQRLREERGVALVEFALVAPLLMLLLFGMVDFGRAFNYWIDETHLANTGARWATVNKNPAGTPGADCTDPTTVCLQEYIVSEADTGELESSAVACIDFLQGGAIVSRAEVLAASDPGDYSVRVKVQMETPFKWLKIVGGDGTEDGVLGLHLVPAHILARSTMRLERSPTNYTDGCFG